MFVYYDKKANSNFENYSFMSEEIDIDYTKYYIANLYDIYSNTILYPRLDSYLLNLQNTRGIGYDGSLRTNYFFHENNFC